MAKYMINIFVGDHYEMNASLEKSAKRAKTETQKKVAGKKPVGKKSSKGSDLNRA